jgi:hypothetical protein
MFDTKLCLIASGLLGLFAFAGSLADICKRDASIVDSRWSLVLLRIFPRVRYELPFPFYSVRRQS